MHECMIGLRQITRKYKTCIEHNLDFRLSDNDLNILKKSIYYLSLIDALVKTWNKEKHEEQKKSEKE